MRSTSVRRNPVLSCFLVALAFCWLSGISHASGITVFWTSDSGKIQAGQLGGSVQDLVTGLSLPIDIAVDPAAGKMYWSDEGTDKIQRANLDGSSVEEVLSQASELSGLALDFEGGKIYFCNRNPGRISRADLIGTNLEVLVISSPEPLGIALDLPASEMYWTDPVSDIIQRANLDGSNVQTVLGVRPDALFLALDLDAGKMYWTNSNLHKILSANLDGTNVQDVVTGLNTPADIVVFDEKLYWTDRFAGKIQRANLDGSNVEDLFTEITLPRGIAVLESGVAAPLDIKPGSCPNAFNRGSHGVLPVALVGTESFDVTQVDISSILLSRADGVGGSVAPNEGPPGPHSVFEDVATPFDGELCDCHELQGDGILDLSMKFRTDDVVAALELDDFRRGDLVELVVTGILLDGTEFEAGDCILIVGGNWQSSDGARDGASEL